MMAIWAPRVGVQLSPEFAAAVEDAPREKIVYGGWRAGKSTLGAFEILLDYFDNRFGVSSALYWIVGPQYEQTDQEFAYLAQWFTKLGLVGTVSAPMEGPRTLVLKDGTRIETKSAEHIVRLGAVAPDFILVCEAGQCSGELRLWMLGRAAEKRARIVYEGTLEDEEGHQMWAWYFELGAEWLEDRNEEHATYSLPSWSNRVVFPGGRNDPEILRLEISYREFTNSDFTFLRKYGGEPAGSPYVIYSQLEAGELIFKPIPEGTKFTRSMGGIDYGTVHPTALVVASLTDNDILWVRECVDSANMRDPGDHDWLRREQLRLKTTYNAWEWTTDPNERYMAKSFQSIGVSYSEAGRGARIGLVQARLNSGRLFFDRNGPGNDRLFYEMAHVHRRKQKNGEMVLVRDKDDRTAALENIHERLDGIVRREVTSLYATRVAAPERRYRRKEFVSRV